MGFWTSFIFTTERSLAGCAWCIPGDQQWCRRALWTVLIHLAPGSCTSEVIPLKKFAKTLIAASETRESKWLYKLLTRNITLWRLKPGAPILGCDILFPVVGRGSPTTWCLLSCSKAALPPSPVQDPKGSHVLHNAECVIGYILFLTTAEWPEKLGLRNLYNNFPSYYKFRTAHSAWQQVLVSHEIVGTIDI